MNKLKFFRKDLWLTNCALLFVSLVMFTFPVLGQSNVTFDADRWEKSKEAIILSDLTKVSPQSALTSDVRRKRQWKVLDYETESGLVGKSISSGPNTAAPKVTLNLKAKVWYAVYIGLGGYGRLMSSYSKCRVLK